MSKTDSFLSWVFAKAHRFFGVGLTVIFVWCFGLAWVLEYAEYVEFEAKIEQLRVDIDRVEGVVSEDIAGQATEWNQHIRMKRRWNEVFIIQLLIPNGWEDIEYIDVYTGV